jgi:hypothetical protein
LKLFLAILDHQPQKLQQREKKQGICSSAAAILCMDVTSYVTSTAGGRNINRPAAQMMVIVATLKLENMRVQYLLLTSFF